MLRMEFDMRYWYYYVDLVDKWALVDNEQTGNRVVGLVAGVSEAKAWLEALGD